MKKKSLIPTNAKHVVLGELPAKDRMVSALIVNETYVNNIFTSIYKQYMNIIKQLY